MYQNRWFKKKEKKLKNTWDRYSCKDCKISFLKLKINYHFREKNRFFEINLGIGTFFFSNLYKIYTCTVSSNELKLLVNSDKYWFSCKLKFICGIITFFILPLLFQTSLIDVSALSEVVETINLGYTNRSKFTHHLWVIKLSC